MAASTEQKVDFLLKKLGYSSSKTGIAEDESSLSGTKKAPFAEPIPSPLVVPDSSVWSNSENIPTTPPGSDTTYIKVYPASGSGWHMTEDTTVSGSRTFVARSTYNNNSTANLKNWIDTQFGPDYVVKVYKGDPNSGGVELAAAGSGSNDTWFFDYSSGVLNFNGTQIPSGVTATNVYIVGYRYIGETGVLTPGDDVSFRNLSVTGVSTLTGDVTAQNNLTVVGNLTVNGDNTILNTSSLEVEDRNIGIASAASKLSDAQIDGAGITIYSANGDKTLTWDNSNSRMAFSHDLFAPNLNISGNLNVTGDVVYDEVTGRNINISGVGTITHLNLTSLSVSTGSTFTGNIDANGNLDVDGHTELDDVNVGSALTVTGNIDANRDVDIAGNVLVGGALTVTGTTTFNGGTLTLGDANTDNVVFGGEVDSNILPDDDNTFDLGSSAKRWQDVYAANFHGDGSNLTNTGASLSAASGTQRLVVTNLTSGTMTTAATDSDLVFIAAHNLLSLNGNLSVTGVATFTGPITAGSSLGADGQYMRRTGAGVTWASFPTLRTTTSFTATANQTSFTWSHNVNFLDVFLNGVKLSSSEYTANGSSVVLNSGCFAGDIVEFHSYNIASTFGGGGGGSSTLPGLTDVTISGASNGQVLKYNGSAWVNAADATGSSYTNSDVDTHLNVSGASSGQILSWNGSDYAWVADQTGGGAAGLWSQNATGIHTLSNVGIGTTTASYGLTVAEGNIARFEGEVQTGTGSTVGIGSTLYFHKLSANTAPNDDFCIRPTGSGTLWFDSESAGDLGVWSATGLKICGNGVGHQNTTTDINTQLHVLNAGNCNVKLQASAMGAVGLKFLNGGSSGSAGHHILSTYDLKMIMASGPDAGDPNRTVGMWRRYTNSNSVNWMGYESYGRFVCKPSYGGSTTLEIDHISGGIDATGIITAAQFSGPIINNNDDITTRNLNVSGVSTFSGNVSIAGTLTYEDVKNVDSVGVVTAREGIRVGAGKSIGSDSGTVTYYGDGSQLTGINAGGLNDGTDINPRHVNASGIITTTSATIGSLGISTVSGNWGANAGVGKTIDSFDVATDDFKTAEYTLWFNYSSGGVSNIQSQKLLVMQDGTTPYSQEFAIMSAPNKIVSVGASMTGTIVNINATPESGISGVTTYKLARNTLL